MSKKAKKQASSMSFSLSRWYSRVSRVRAPTLVISAAVVVTAIFLFSGGLYVLAVHPAVYIYYNSKFYFIMNRYISSTPLSQQFSSETAILGVLYAFGFAGLLTIYQSTKHAYNSRQANLMLVVGVALLFIAYIFLEAVIGLKFASS